jgi:hypothetical protein
MGSRMRIMNKDLSSTNSIKINKRKSFINVTHKNNNIPMRHISIDFKEERMLSK